METSLLDGALAYHSMMWGESDACVASQVASPLSIVAARMRLVTRSFECGDGEYLGIHTGAVGAFGRAMKVLGIDDRVPPSETGMDMGVPLTPEQMRILKRELVDIFATQPRAEWVQRLLEADVCAVEHLRPTEVFDAPQAAPQRDGGRRSTIPCSARSSRRARGEVLADTGFGAHPAPTVGEHTDDVLATSPAGRHRPIRRPGGARPTRPLLDGVKILDLGAYYAGPYSSRLLADLGADVMKLEPMPATRSGASSGRSSPRRPASAPWPRTSRTPRCATSEGLLGWADVVHHNLRPGAAERLGLDDDSVRTVNPDIVYLHAPGWGSTGPFTLRQSFAPMLSGYVGVTYEMAGQFNPPMPPTANEDPGNGLLGAVAVLLALLHRDRTVSASRSRTRSSTPRWATSRTSCARPTATVIGAGRLDPLQIGRGAFERLYETS